VVTLAAVSGLLLVLLSLAIVLLGLGERGDERARRERTCGVSAPRRRPR